MQPMRRLIFVVALVTATAAAPSASAARTGTIEGRVINGTTDEPQRGVEVTLTVGDGDRRYEKTLTTGADGRYRFENLRTGEQRFFVLDAVYKEGLFAGKPLTIPDDTDEPPVIETTLRVFEPTSDPAAILIRRNHLYLVHQDDRVTVVESVKVVNPTNNAYIGRGSELATADDDQAVPSLGFALPEGTIPESFRWVEADLDVPGAVELQGIGFGITPAIPPGELDFTFSYQVVGEGGTFDLTRRALYETTELSVFAAPPLEVSSNRLQRGEDLELEGTVYQRFSSPGSLDPADPIQLLIVAEGGSTFPLVAGAAGGLVLLLGIGVLAFRRTRGSAPAVGDRDSGIPREELVAAIAELDLRRDAGELDEGEHARRRHELKRRLADASSSGDV